MLCMLGAMLSLDRSMSDAKLLHVNLPYRELKRPVELDVTRKRVQISARSGTGCSIAHF